MCNNHNVIEDYNNFKRIETHWHSDLSNLRLLDCINTVKASIEKAVEFGLSGMALTDHESLSGHVKAMQIRDEMKKDGKMDKDFKLILGNELYLVDSLEDVRDNYVGGGITKFPHFLIMAKNKKGHEAMRIMSSQAWKNSFFTGTLERVPTEKEFMYRLLTQPEYKGTLMATSACLGSESSIHIMARGLALKENRIKDAEFHEYRLKMFIEWNINLFGKDDFYLELQPSPDYEQRLVNECLLQLSEEYGLKTIIANDVHYLRPEDREIHSAYLRAKEDERETDSFYAHTYLHTVDETFEKLSYLPQEVIIQSFKNSLEIGDKCEDYTLEAPTVIPVSQLPEFELWHLFQDGYEQYEFIRNMAYSDSEQDRFLLHEVEKGFYDKIYNRGFSKERLHEYIARIDVELEQLWKITEKINSKIANEEEHQHMSSYYVTTFMLVNAIWGDDCGDASQKEGSLLGSGRGSAVAFLINYLMGITQVDPLNYGLEIPYWRHLNHEMGDISALDIDLDVTSTKKKYIFQRMKDKWGEDSVIQVCTFGKEKPKSAIKTAARGLGIPQEDAAYIGSFIKFERGEHWSLTDCLEGNEEEGREPIPEFIREIEKYPGLKETALKIEGLINKRSTHAGGVMVYNGSYVNSNALMRSPNGDFVTQFNLDDSQATGGIKFDVLTIEGNDKIQATMDLLLEYGEIEWQGTLRKTFEKYFHPEIIDKDSSELFDLLGSGKVPDLFQFSTAIGQSVVKKAKPSNLIETAAINSVMRLAGDGGEQPIDTFIRFKENPELWYEEMRDFGLDEKQIGVFKDYLEVLNGVADTQESIMLMSMDDRISGFNLKDSTALRKAVSKKKKEAAMEIKKKLFDMCKERGNDIKMAEYTWHQIERMLSYAFSLPHVLAYTLIAFIQLNIFKYYNPLYWQTACLTINSGSVELEEGDKKKDKNYGKVAEAIGKLKNYGVNVALPDINIADISFKPDTANDRIVYSLKGISGMNDDTSRIVIENRPYTSFEDFHERVYSNALLGHDEDGNEIRGGLIKRGTMLNLIKAGAFNEFCTPVDAMTKFVYNDIDIKTTLTMQNIKSIIRLGLLHKDEYQKYLTVYYLRDTVKKQVHATVGKEVILKLKPAQYLDYEKFLLPLGKIKDSIVEQRPDCTLIKAKALEDQYKKFIEPLRTIITTEEFIRDYNIAQFYEVWNVVAQGTVEKWEMDSVTYYSDKHELDSVDYKKYNISNFFEIDPEPVVTETYTMRGREYQKYETHTIIGTCVDRNKDKHTFTLLTPDGVVTCKMYGGVFANYDKAITKMINGVNTNVEKSWFTRGNLLMVRGFRREDQFVTRTYAQKGQQKQHTINMITAVTEEGELYLKTERG